MARKKKKKPGRKRTNTRTSRTQNVTSNITGLTATGKSRSKSGNSNSSNSTANDAVAVADIASKSESLIEEASAAFTDEAITESADTPEPTAEKATHSEKELIELYGQLRAAKDKFDSATAKVDEERKSLDSEKQKISDQKSELAATRDEVTEKRESQANELAELTALRAASHTNFLGDRVDVLRQTNDGIGKLTEEIYQSLELLSERQREFLETVAENKLGNEESLEAERKQLLSDQRKLEWAKEDLDEQLKTARERAVAETAGVQEQLETKAIDLTKRIDAARSDRDEALQRLEKAESLLSGFDDQSPQAIMADITRYRKEIESLKEQLDVRPTQNLVADHHALQNEYELLQKSLDDKQSELSRKQSLIDRTMLDLKEHESLKAANQALEGHNRLLEEKIRNLRSQIEAFIEGDAKRTPFPECRRMDEDSELQTESPVATNKTLKGFANWAPQQIAFMSSTTGHSGPLYYSDPDIRCFIAGLATSRLHILQGISGTGKTSLPTAFARAIGGGQKLIAVQAGWRDRQDLLGHYNTFEKKYYETEFLQALYEAQTPQYRERLYFIILDEMNLSHFEQYAADLNSELEKPDSLDQNIALTTSRLPAPPQLLFAGRKISIPDNVWFIGTANHDETTKDFADKTYDRAHVIELPRQRQQFKFDPGQITNPLSCSHTLGLFYKAQEEFRGQAEQCYQFIHKHFSDFLANSFGISWGNRLFKDASLYIPVNLACGGNAAEATDHLFCTKVLRKLRNRHDIRPEDLEELYLKLQEDVNNSKPLMTSRFAKCEQLLGHELVRHGIAID